MTASDPEFRIRWALVSNGEERVRMCIAERKYRIFGWWPLGSWRHSEHTALQDIEAYKRLHSPLPETKYFT